MAKKTTSRRVYYSMGEVCEMFDLPASTIRFWEKKFKVLAPTKNSKGNRQFTPTDVDNLKIIHNLVKERGMTIEGADIYMQNERVLLKQNVTAIELLQQVRSMLVDIRNEIDSTSSKSPSQILITEEIDQEVNTNNKPHYVEQTLFDLDEL